MISKLAESGSGKQEQNRTIARRVRDALAIEIEFPNVRKVSDEKYSLPNEPQSGDSREQ